MGRPIKHVVAVLLVCFTLLFVQLNRIQVYEAGELEDHPANTRTILRDFNRPRGDIVTADNITVATSQPTPDSSFDSQRVYPQGPLYAHVSGYISFTFGADGVEREYNDALIGRTDSQVFDGLTSFLSGQDPIGNVRLTLRHDLQTAAADGLAGRFGAAVALDPRTGAILALYSNPTFDPNEVAANNGTLANEAWTELVETEGNPLRAKAYRDIFFPGSTFKVITAAAALETDAVATFEPEFPVVESYTPPLTDRAIANFGQSSCGGNLVELLVVSCNAGFAQIGAELLGPAALVAAAEQFGFNSEPPTDLPLPVASRFPTDFGSRVDGPTAEIPAGVFENTPALAQSAIGQNDVAATPLQMALVAAAVANEGEILTPHVLATIEDRESGRVIARYDPSAWRRAMSADTAALLADAMGQVVERGTARNLALPGVSVGAKTGTAQLGTDPPRSHAWVIAFAGPPEQAPEIAVAVLVEGQEGSEDQTGGGVAAPIARRILERYFNS